ncbi:MAG: flagellar hook assembly protein FlgD [Burkholderiaceae bacterium]|nr:flagellar hook assembly protein FlgD [Burkholderiaceae bacterium]
MSTSTSNTVSNALLAAMNPQSNSASSSAQGAQDRFMTLLVTQLKNQDPLNPMDNAQMTSQLAQLSTVSGIDKMNTTLQSLISSYQQSQTLQATSMIGHGVLTAGDTMTLSNGSAAFGVSLATAAGDVKVTIKNGSGQAIDTLDLGQQSAGVVPLAWNGKTSSGATAPDGNYTFTVTSTTGGKSTDSASPLTYGTVQSVSAGSTGVNLNLTNGSTIGLSDAVQVF